MDEQTLIRTARDLVAPNKGILAADESFPTIAKRFAGIGVETSTEELRRTYRGMLFTAPGAEAYISGVIMFHETLGQRTDAGELFPAALAARGILSGDTRGSVLRGRIDSAYRNGLILTFGGGTNEIQRDIIAMAGMGMPNYKD